MGRSSPTIDCMSQLVAESAADTRAHYDRHGVVHVPGLLRPEEADAIRSAFTTQVETDRSLGWDDHVPDDDPLSRYPRFVQPHRRLDTEVGRLARRWMLDPRLVGIVAALIGPPLAAQSMFYFKPPSARGQALHQDNLFLQAAPETCLAAWIAIDGCDAANGALQVVPGSHTYELECPQDADTTESFTSKAVSVPAGLTAVQTEMAAGDVLFFHGSLVHGSRPNTTADRFRRSLIFHYVPAASLEIARFYQPLLTPAGAEHTIDAAVDGGPCGAGWQPVAAH